MAIEITNFNHTTTSAEEVEANAAEVLAWLQTNAMEYFPGGFEKTGTVSGSDCKILCKNSSSLAVLEIPFCQGSNSYGKVRSTYYSGVNILHGTATHVPFDKAIKTSYGFALVDKTNGETWFVSKTNNGDTCFCGIIDGNTTPGTFSGNLIFIDMSLSLSQSSLGATGALSAIKGYLRAYNQGSKAVLTPIAFDCGSYTENLFYVPFTPLNVATGIQRVMLDGTEYVYDGVLALKG